MLKITLNQTGCQEIEASPRRQFSILIEDTGWIPDISAPVTTIMYDTKM